MKQIKIKPFLGAPPEGGFWTKEEQDRHDAYVEELKKEGKYLTEGEEITINLQEYNKIIPQKTDKSFVGNFGMVIPKK